MRNQPFFKTRLSQTAYQQRKDCVFHRSACLRRVPKIEGNRLFLGKKHVICGAKLLASRLVNSVLPITIMLRKMLSFRQHLWLLDGFF